MFMEKKLLRKFDDIVYDSFKEAAIGIGLLKDDREIISSLRESSGIQSGCFLQELFALILAINTFAFLAEV
jgi:hypothetical protein